MDLQFPTTTSPKMLPKILMLSDRKQQSPSKSQPSHRSLDPPD
jgi:hypothetical protein